MTRVRQVLAQQMRALITRGTYRPGDRITERELCERFKASRPSIREALRQLEAEGLLDIHPHRGPVVRVLSATSVIELWEVRLALETLIAERFAMQGKPQQIERLARSIRGMDAALRSKDKTRIRTAKNLLVEAFAAGANNEMLAEYFRHINVRLSFLWSSSLMFPGRPAESIREQYALLAAIKSRNAAAARVAILLYNEHAKAIAMYSLRVSEEARNGNGGRKR